MVRRRLHDRIGPGLEPLEIPGEEKMIHQAEESPAVRLMIRRRRAVSLRIDLIGDAPVPADRLREAPEKELGRLELPRPVQRRRRRRRLDAVEGLGRNDGLPHPRPLGRDQDLSRRSAECVGQPLVRQVQTDLVEAVVSFPGDVRSGISLHDAGGKKKEKLCRRSHMGEFARRGREVEIEPAGCSRGVALCRRRDLCRSMGGDADQGRGPVPAENGLAHFYPLSKGGDRPVEAVRSLDQEEPDRHVLTAHVEDPDPVAEGRGAAGTLVIAVSCQGGELRFHVQALARRPARFRDGAVILSQREDRRAGLRGVQGSGVEPREPDRGVR